MRASIHAPQRGWQRMPIRCVRDFVSLGRPAKSHRVSVLPLHAPRGVAAQQADDLLAVDVVEIALDRMLEATRGDGEGDGLVWSREIAARQSVKQSSGERIAAADAIDDVAN